MFISVILSFSFSIIVPSCGGSLFFYTIKKETEMKYQQSAAGRLTKTTWVYLPYGYSEDEEYNVFYLSHGGWSNETTIMGTSQGYHSFKHVKITLLRMGKKPLIIILPTYNNTSESDNGDFLRGLPHPGITGDSAGFPWAR